MKKFLAYIVVLGFANATIVCWAIGQRGLAIAVGVVTAVISIVLHDLLLFRPARRVAANLDQMLTERGYRNATVLPILASSIARWLRGSMLDTDFGFGVGKAWHRRATDCDLVWGRYATSGEGLEGGVFFAIVFERPFAREAVVRRQASSGTRSAIGELNELSVEPSSCHPWIDRFSKDLISKLTRLGDCTLQFL